VLDKYEILIDWCGTSPNPRQNLGYGEVLWGFSTLSRLELFPFWELFYLRGEKRISPVILEKYWSPEMAAWWIMDDGSYQGGMIHMHTESYRHADLKRVASWLGGQGLFTSVCKAREYFRLCFSVAASERLAHMIRPHTLPSMMYKIQPVLQRSLTRQQRRCTICQGPIAEDLRLDTLLCSPRCRRAQKVIEGQIEYHGVQLETAEEILSRLVFSKSGKWKLQRKSMTYR
jgi:hypothetical protein